MTNPLHAACYADQALAATVEITQHARLARDTCRVRFDCPPIARRIVPGQFLMMRLAGVNDPLIGRALALYDTALDGAGRPAEIDVVYVAGGKFTRRLAQLPVGARLEVWGPLGNGFPAEPAEHLVMAAGGIGQTPFMALAREYLGDRQYGDPPREPARTQQATLCYGTRTADLLAGVEDFERLGVRVHLATDDGTRGHHGLVTDLVARVLDENRLAPRMVCCGPEPMMEATAHLAERRGVPCRVSLEAPMACGIGICFTCVAKVRDGDGGWDYKRTCVEGPIFDASAIEW